jgi:transposase-like protein
MPKKSLRKRYSSQQKAQIVLEVLKEEQTLSQIASTYAVHATQLRKWRTQAVAGLPRLFDDEQKALRELEAQQAQERQALYAEIGRLTTQLGWLKKKSGLDVQSD